MPASPRRRYFQRAARRERLLWEHDVFDDQGRFVRNLVGLRAIGLAGDDPGAISSARPLTIAPRVGLVAARPLAPALGSVARAAAEGQPIYLPFAARPAIVLGPPTGLRIARTFGGPSYGLAIGDGVAYQGHGSSITVIDLTGPHAPQEIWRTEDLPGLVLDIAVEGDRLYAALGESGFAVLDRSDPRRPIRMSTTPTGGSASGVAATAAVVFVAAGMEGLQAYDVADGAAPRRLSITQAEGLAARVWLYHGHAYVSDMAGGPIQVYDIADPTTLRYAAALDDEGLGSFDIAFYQDHAYVATCTSCVRILDVADPSAPRVIETTMTIPSTVMGVATEGSRLFLSGRGSLSVYDLTDPQSQACARRWRSLATPGWSP